MLIDKNSVSATLDAVNAAMFEGRSLGAPERMRVARWLAARQGLTGAYANTFAGFDQERRQGIVTFTGERLTSASARHILGEEACRALRLLDVDDESVSSALENAERGLFASLVRWEGSGRGKAGLFCCGKCSVALWRNLLAGGLDRQEERLQLGVSALRARRDGQGRWSGFPFWYVVLALTDIATAPAQAELRYAAAQLERAATRAPSAAVYAQRRHELARRALAVRR